MQVLIPALISFSNSGKFTGEYYLDYPDDRLFTKLAVYVLYATETAQTVLVVYLAFVDLMLNGEASFNAFGVSGVVLGSVGKISEHQWLLNANEDV